MSLDYRFFWTWDHSTNYCHNTPGNQSIGANNDYAKAPEVFLEDYRRAIDWCELHHIDAIGVAGLLRDRHGGVDAARRICEYARERNVRVYMIAGLLAYGGVYHEGNHEFALENFLARHPECLARNADGVPLIVDIAGQSGTKRVRHACPSHPKVEKFVLKSLEWVFQAIPELGGIQIETGDTGVCLCEKCRARRQYPVAENACMSFEDMGLYYPKAVDAVLAAAPDAWVICETYNHFNVDSENRQDAFGGGMLEWAFEGLGNVSQEAFFQWVCDRWMFDDKWTEHDKIPLPGYRHIMRAHHGTYWLNYRHKLSLDNIRRQCALSVHSGLQGVSMFGEGSPFHANVEFNYLAFEYFAEHPLAALDDFAADVMAPRLGGVEAARQYIEFEATVDAPEFIPGALAGIVRRLPQLKQPEAERRWLWLGSYLGSFLWEAQIRARGKDGNVFRQH